METLTVGNFVTLGLLVLLQAVLGFDNLLYISLESKRAPAESQSKVRKLGIGLAVLFRIGLLFLLVNLIRYFQDPLFAFEATVLEAQVNEARANAARSEAALKRAEELYRKKLISADDYDTARANYDVDAARLRSSRAVLSKMVIRAPFDGFAGIRRINVGDYATVGQELVDVVKLDPLRVNFSLPEILLAKVRPGLRVAVTTDAYPEDSFTGTITAIAPRADVAGHSIEVRANLPNPELRLRPGLFVRVNVSLGGREDAIVIPEEAIWPVGQDKTVFVVVDGKAVQRIVRIGTRQPGVVEILSGLEEGEVVVTAGQMKLHDGAAVQPVGGSSAATN